MRKSNIIKRKQSGAALVVGLVMLSILTLLAITAMNTSSTELIMAGNEQFRERAFQAAEAGVEMATKNLASVPQTGAAIESKNQPIASQTDDNYSISSVYIGEDNDIPGYNASFSGLHYRIDSTGKSRRNAISAHQQGAYVISSAATGFTPWLPGAEAP